jgi:2-haloacid dehalogenase
MEDFLANVCTVEWNERQDAGRTFAEAHAELLPRHADKSHLIEAFGKRFDEMIAGPIEGTVGILARVEARRRSALCAHQLVGRDVSASASRATNSCSWFDGNCRLGQGRRDQPDARIFASCSSAIAFLPMRRFFIDDNPANATAAQALASMASIS